MPGSLDIRQIDVHDDAIFADFYAIARAAELHERPDVPMHSEAELAVHFRHPDQTETWTAYAAFDGDTMVGAAYVVCPLKDNTNMTWNAVLVAPERRCRGIGTALLDFVGRTTADLGRDTALLESCYAIDRRDDHPYRRFAERNGYTLASTEIIRVLDLPIADDQLDRWAEEAAPHHRDYTLRSFVDDIPEQLLPSFCYLENQLPLDAPTGEVDFEAGQLTPDDWREIQAKLKEQRRTLFTTLALDESGEAVGLTTLMVPELDPGKAHQWATLVRRDHRGHRLGLAVKVANLRQLQRLRPDVTRIFTGNEQTNGPMVRINEQLGFRPLELCVEFQRKL